MNDLETRLVECLERLAPDDADRVAPVPPFTAVQARSRRLHRRDLTRRTLVTLTVVGAIAAAMLATNRPSRIELTTRVASPNSTNTPESSPPSSPTPVADPTVRIISPLVASLPTTSGWTQTGGSIAPHSGEATVSYALDTDTLSLTTARGTDLSRLPIDRREVRVNGTPAFIYECGVCDGLNRQMLSWAKADTTVTLASSSLSADEMLALATQVTMVPVTALFSGMSWSGLGVSVVPQSATVVGVDGAGPTTTEATIATGRITEPYLTPLGEPDEHADSNGRSAYRIDPAPADLEPLTDAATVNASAPDVAPIQLRFGLFTGWDGSSDPARFIRNVPVWVISKPTEGGRSCLGCPIEKGYDVEVRADGDLGRLMSFATFLGDNAALPK